MRKHVIILVTILIIFSAGYVVSNIDSSTDEPTKPISTESVGAELTATPVESENSKLPPGVNEDGEINSDILSTAHRTAIVNRSYVFTVYQSDNNVPISSVLCVENEENYLFRSQSDTNDSKRIRYATNGKWYAIFDRPGRTQYSEGTAPHAADAYGHVSTSAVRQYLSTSDAAIEVHSQGTSDYYTIQVSLSESESTQSGVVHANITSGGFVQSLVVIPSIDRLSVQETVFSFQYSQLGQTTVSPPSRVSENWPAEFDDAKSPNKCKINN
jgi:hypothetical protein